MYFMFTAVSSTPTVLEGEAFPVQHNSGSNDGEHIVYKTKIQNKNNNGGSKHL